MSVSWSRAYVRGDLVLVWLTFVDRLAASTAKRFKGSGRQGLQRTRIERETLPSPLQAGDEAWGTSPSPRNVENKGERTFG